MILVAQRIPHTSTLSTTSGTLSWLVRVQGREVMILSWLVRVRGELMISIAQNVRGVQSLELVENTLRYGESSGPLLCPAVCSDGGGVVGWENLLSPSESSADPRRCGIDSGESVEVPGGKR